MKNKTLFFSSLVAALHIPLRAYAETPGKIDTGDTAFVLLSAALVMLMTPGLAMFYGGMVRRKNVLGTIMHSFVAIALVSVQWVLIGYSLSFGPDINGMIGSLAWIGLNGVGIEPNPDYAATIPHIAFMIYQAMFAVITPALIAGAFAERMKFSAFLVFTLLWTTIVYDPVAHWVWGTGGWLKNLGTLDFAGGIVVHITSGISALAAALLIGRRKGYLREPMAPHNLPMTVLGAGLLWFGWFGFNAGSALSSGGLSAMAFVATHHSSCICNAYLGPHRMAPQGETDHVWGCYRLNRRACNDHPCLRLCRPNASACHRPAGRSCLLYFFEYERKARL